jgi:DNA helicase-2/ATP-dependent DNA helicase PcrA
VSYFRPENAREIAPRSACSLPNSTQKMSQKGGRVSSLPNSTQKMSQKGGRVTFSVDSRDEAQRRGEARKLTEFLFFHRDPAHPLRRWLEELEEKCLRSALIRGGMLRDEQETFQSLLGLTDKDAELSDATVASFAGQAGSPNNLNLITLHSAKGLEFDVVILLGMDQGRLPSWRVNSADGMAEARRLFYVGITRARHEVHLTYSGFREGTYGQIYADGPSIFLKEIQQRLQR